MLLCGATDDFADRVVGEVDRGDDSCPQHVAQTFTDRLEQVGLVGEMPVDLRFCGARLFGDFADTQVGAEAIDGTKRRLHDLRAHLLAVLFPAFTARVNFHRGLGPRVRQRRPRNSDHVEHHTAAEPLTWADWLAPARRVASCDTQTAGIRALSGHWRDRVPDVGQSERGGEFGPDRGEIRGGAGRRRVGRDVDEGDDGGTGWGYEIVEDSRRAVVELIAPLRSERNVMQRETSTVPSGVVKLVVVSSENEKPHEGKETISVVQLGSHRGRHTVAGGDNLGIVVKEPIRHAIVIESQNESGNCRPQECNCRPIDSHGRTESWNVL